MRGDLPAVGLDAQQGAGFGLAFIAHRQQRRHAQHALRQQYLRRASRAMAQRAHQALQRLSRAIPTDDAAGRRLPPVGVKAAAGLGIRQRRHLPIQRFDRSRR